MLSAFITIHDVMPETLSGVQQLVTAMHGAGLPPATMLVTPGRDWTAPDLDRLHRFQAAGHSLAGHGWSHHAPKVSSLYHRMYSTLISRRAAEHLDQPPVELAGLVQACFAWFSEHGFGSPVYYVPPAWALGALSRTELQKLPFRWYETLIGLYDSDLGTFTRLPLAGFDADTAFRRWFLLCWNRLNVSVARCSSRPVRVALHPNDLNLFLAAEARAFFAQQLRCVTVDGVVVSKSV